MLFIESKSQTIYFSTYYPYNVTLISDATNHSYLISGETNISTFIGRIDNKGHLLNSNVLLDSLSSINLFKLTATKNLLFAHTTNLLYDSICVIAFNPDGSIAWQRYTPRGFSIDQRHNSVSAKNNEVGIIFTNNFDVMLERLDSNGNQIGLVKVNNCYASIATNIKRHSPNRFVFTGKDTNSYYQWEKGVETLNYIDTLGNLIWQKEFKHDTAFAGFYDIKILGNYIYPIYYLRDSVTFIERLICYKIDTLGNIIGSKELIEPTRLWLSELPNSYIESRNEDAFYFFVESNYAKYSELKKVDSDLNIKWTLRLNPLLRAIGLGNCNSIICSFINETEFGNVIQDIKDPELTEVCAHCGISVYPNPSTDLIYLSSEYKDVLIKGISIWDMLGKSVLEYNLEVPVSNHVLTNQLASGMYISEIKCDNGMKVLKKLFISSQ